MEGHRSLESYPFIEQMYLFYFEKAAIVKQYTEEIIQFHFTVNCVERIVFHFFPAINHATKFPVR